MQIVDFKLVILVAALAGLGYASPPPTLGTVTSTDNFRLSGADVSVAGVPSWPLVVGDELQAGASSAMLRFRDGSRVVLASNSRVILEQRGAAGARVRLLSGSLRYSKNKNSLIEIVANKVTSTTPSYDHATVWISGGNGFISSASPITFVPAPVFRPGPLNLPSGDQLPNSTSPPSVTVPGAGSLTPWLSARP